MAPLSVLPGRVRFEASILIGSEEGCDLIEEKITSIEGVVEASASIFPVVEQRMQVAPSFS